MNVLSALAMLRTVAGLVSKLPGFVKTASPVLAILAVLIGKLAAGDYTGFPELLSALVAAIGAVYNGTQVAGLKAQIAAKLPS